MVEQTLYNWVKAQRLGELSGLDSKPVSAAQMEFSRLRAELAGWVYTKDLNYAKTMLPVARERENLNVINDKFGAATGADLIADVTAHAIAHVMRKPDDAELYHLAPSNETNCFNYAKYVLGQSIRARAAPKIIVNTINSVATSAFPTAAERPHNSRLNTAKIQQSLGMRLAPWQDGVTRMLAESQ